MVLARITPANLYAPAPSTKRGEASPLALTPKGDFFVYAAGKLVVIRSVTNPIEARIYAEHTCAVTAVAVSPSGEWIASGDERGTVRVWANQPEMKLKLETIALGGKVLEIAWSADNTRLCAVGEGREAFGKVFTWDSGNTLGAIDSHSKRIITCAFKPTRPFRIATGSDDLAVNWYEGPPFKFKAAHRTHARYPNCVRFSPDGSTLVSVGGDAKIVAYDGASGEVVAEVAGEAHGGSIMACAWSPDSQRLLTASADKTLKVWDMASRAPIRTIALAAAPEVADMQVACAWQGPTACSLSYSGRLNLVDPTAGTVLASMMGHNNALTALALDAGADGGGGRRFVSASFDGVVCAWDARTGVCEVVRGKGVGSAVALAVLPGELLAAATVESAVQFASLASMEFDAHAAVKLDGSARAICAAGGVLAVVTERTLFVVAPGKVLAETAAGCAASRVAVSPDGAQIAVGGEDGTVALFEFQAGKLRALPGACKRHKEAVTALAYSPSGAHLASCDAARQLFAWALPGFEPVSSSWVAHKASVTAVGWAPSGRLLVTGGVDSSIILWSLDEPGENVTVRLAHADGVTAVGFVDDETIISAGKDSCVKTWAIKK